MMQRRSLLLTTLALAACSAEKPKPAFKNIDITGAAYPRTFRGEAIHPMEGVSLRPAFAGRPLARPGPLFWEHEGNKAMRLGPWKLVAKHKQAWALYDIGADRTEQRDLAAAQPERVKAMAAQWQAWADRVGVVPWAHEIPEGSGASPTGKKKKTKKTTKNLQVVD